MICGRHQDRNAREAAGKIERKPKRFASFVQLTVTKQKYYNTAQRMQYSFSMLPKLSQESFL